MNPLPDQAQDFWKQYWVGIYETPRAWADKGQNLIHAFEVLAAASQDRSLHFNVHDQALMLAGMASEVLLKALLINCPRVRTIVTTRPKELDDASADVHRTFYRHDLMRLASLAGVALSKKQETTANGLSEFISWRGRYVLPTEANLDDLAPVPLDGGHAGPRHLSVTIDGSRDLLSRLVDEVKSRLYGESA